MSKIKIHRLNKKREKIGIKELDLTKYSKFGSTGNGVYCQPKRGRGLMLNGEHQFDVYKRAQDFNDKGAGRCFTYAKIDENKSDSVKNRRRDEKGRPIRIYEEVKDYYKEWGISKWWFIDDKNWNKLLEYIKLSGTPHLYYEATTGKWTDF